MRALVLLPLSAAALWSVGRVVTHDVNQPATGSPDTADQDTDATELAFEDLDTSGAIAQPEALTIPPPPPIVPRSALQPLPPTIQLPPIAVSRTATPATPALSWDSVVARSINQAATPPAAPAASATPAARTAQPAPPAQSAPAASGILSATSGTSAIAATSAPPPAQPATPRSSVLPGGLLPAPPMAIAPESMPERRSPQPSLPAVELDSAAPEADSAAEPEAAAEPSLTPSAAPPTAVSAPERMTPPIATESEQAEETETLPDAIEIPVTLEAPTAAPTAEQADLPETEAEEDQLTEQADLPAAETVLVADARLAQPSADVAIRTAPAQASPAQAPLRQTAPLPAAPAFQASPVRASRVGADPSYVLGAGDVISLSIVNVPEYSGEQQVLVDGSLNLPLIGRVPIAGMTLEQAGYALAARYSDELRNPLVTVGLVTPRPLQVAIAGEVRLPGLYTLSLTEDSRFPGVVQAIQAAGGTTQAANLRQVEVRRPQASGATQRLVVNLWDLVENGNQSQNLTLRDGDTIVIPPAEAINPTETAQLAASNLATTEAQTFNVAVVGEVFRPGAYQMASSAGDQPTVVQAIQMAGGVRPSANLRQVEVRRPTRSGSEQVITLDFWRLLQAGDLSQDLILQQGDTVTIPAAADLSPAEAAQLAAANISPESIQINVVGEVRSPGSVTVQANTTLSQAILAAGGLNDRARREVELVRINPDGTLTRREIEVDLSQGINSDTNPVLRQNDVIIVDRTQSSRLLNQFGNALDAVLQLLPLF